MGKFDDQIARYKGFAKQMREDAADLKSGRIFRQEERQGEIVDISQELADKLDGRAVDMDGLVAAYEKINA